MVTGYGNLEWRHSPNAQSCDLAWTAASQGGVPTERSEDFSRELHGESGESQPAEPTDDAEARADFWSIQGDFTYRHHNEPRVQRYVPKEEPFPIPLKYFDVTRSPHIQIWMCYKRNGLTITGMSIRADICQILGKDSQSSRY